MKDQQKLLRLLKLITLLSSSRKRTAEDYAQTLGISLATIHRHLNLLRDAGFDIQKDAQHCHYLPAPSADSRTLLHFTTEELQELYIIVCSLSSPLQQSLLNKIYAGSELADNVYSLQKAQISSIYKQLSQAIGEQKQVILKQYFSENSQTICDRHVEPIRLDGDHMLLVAYEISSRETKHFKLDRMETVSVLQKTIRYKSRHADGTPTDPFGVVHPDLVWVKLQLSTLAKHRLQETFPGSIPFVRIQQNKSYFEGEVNADFKLVDRFLLSYCDAITVMYPASLKTHLEMLWKEKTL